MPSLRSTIVSTGLFSLVVMMLKLSIPTVTQFAAAEFPLFVAWLRPPYLYLVINCIIISIVASSKLQLQKGTLDDHTEHPLKLDTDMEEEEEGGYGEEVDASTLVEFRSTSNPVGYNLDKGSRKLAKKIPNQGTVPKEPKREEQESIESTWKAITEGRPAPLTKQLKKSDTWSSRARRRDVTTSSPAPKMKKSETFAGDRSSWSETKDEGHAMRLIRGEPSMSQDELNRRVEAFIKRFNEEMRLQRQTSLI